MRFPDRFEACLALVDGDRVVDIGCNKGEFVTELLKRFPEKHVLGVDYSSDHIEKARFNHPEHRDCFRVMSVYDLELEPNSVDCVSLQATIEHLEQAALAIKQINRVLKKGGSLIVTTDNPYYWRWILGHGRSEIGNALRRRLHKKTHLWPLIFHRDVEYARHVYAWTPSALLTLLVVNGFEYQEHHYVSESNNWFEAASTRLMPYFGQTQVLKVRKVAEAPERFV